MTASERNGGDSHDLSVDVAVVGSGAAGALAALAARAAGARVAVVRRAYGATAMSSGCIDLGRDRNRLPGDGFAGARPGLTRRLDVLRRLEPDHPLSVLRADRDEVTAALTLLRQHVPGVAAFDPERPPALVATTGGTWKETGTGMAGVLRGELSAIAGGAGDIVVVGLESVFNWNADALAGALGAALGAEGLTAPVRGVTVDVVREWRLAAAGPFALARTLDVDGAAQRLGEEVARSCQQRGLRPALVLLPPVIGLERSREAMAACEQSAGVRCAEMASTPASVPGLRLQRGLDTALRDAGIAVLDGEASAGNDGGSLSLGDRLRGTLSFKQLVLATGKFLAGGIAKDPGAGFRESVLGLPVTDGVGEDPELNPTLATSSSALGRHPLFAYGVRVDTTLRPVGAGAAALRENVRCAGSILAGYAYVTDSAAMGTALVTGFRAGRLAAHDAGFRSQASTPHDAGNGMKAAS